MKKTKFMTKVMAVVFALAILFAMSVPALAADTPNSNDGTQAHSSPVTVVTSNTSVAINKSIVLYNATASQIFTPNVTYTYSVAPAGIAANVGVEGLVYGDAVNDTTTAVKVRDGIAGGVKLAAASTDTGDSSVNVVFANGNAVDSAAPLREGVTATTTNAVAATTNKEFYIKFDPSAIYNNGTNPAGVYRYKITDETTRATLAAAGILRDDDYDTNYKTIYLDVYLQNVTDQATGAVTGLSVYGYVLFKGDRDESFTYDSSASDDPKITGFDSNSEIDPTSGSVDVISDQYHTYNLTVSKTTSGALANQNNYFPFTVTINEAANNTATKVVVTNTNVQNNTVTYSSTAINSGDSALLAAGASPSVFTTAIKHGGSVTFTGVPTYVNYDANGAYTSSTYATANAQETNNTYDKYTASAKDEADTTLTLDDDSTSKVINNAGTATLKTADSIDGGTNQNVTNVIAFTNAIEQLSPTGLAFRVAPYVLMLTAGVSLIVLFAKRRREITDMI